MKEHKSYIGEIILILLLILVIVLLKSMASLKTEDQVENTKVVANDPQESSSVFEEAEKLPELQDEIEKQAIELEPIIMRTNKENGQLQTYAYIEMETAILKELSREEYHQLIDTISAYPYEYFTVVLEDGTGIVYHPAYAYWGIYGTLDSEYYVEDVIHYIDAKHEEVEIVTKDRVKDVDQFIRSITDEYQALGWYQVETSFLYDNIYQCNVTVNIKNDSLKDAKAAVKAIEQKSKTSEYQINFEITCVNDGQEVLVMSFGEEYAQYVYVENGHRITLDTLD